MTEKIYCGNARIIKTQFGDFTKLSMSKDDINKVVKWMKENKSNWVNMAIMEKRSPEDGKPTHYAVIDEWKPKEGNQEYRPAKPGGREPDNISTDIPETNLPDEEETDLPF